MIPTAILILSSSLGLRLAYLWRTQWLIDSDEAITGLMARHILQGIRRPIFYYGQDYLGSLEAWLSAGMFKVFGSSIVTIKLVPLLLGILFIGSCGLLAGTLFGKREGLVALGLAAWPSAFLVMYQTKAWMGHMEMAIFGNLSLMIAHQLIANKHLTWRWGFFGFVCGFGFWISPLMVAYIITAALLLLIYGALNTRKAVLAVPAAILGAAPFIAYNVRHPWVSLGVGGWANLSDISSHASNLLAVGLPILLGARANRSLTDLWPGATVVAYVLLAVCLALAFIQCRLESRARAGCLTGALLATIAALFFIFTRYGFWALEPRYLVPIASSVIVIQSIAITTLWRRAQVLGAILIAAILLLNLTSNVLVRPMDARPVIAGIPVEMSNDRLIQVLKQADISYAKANYWIAYRLIFETNETIICSPEIEGAPSQDRFTAYLQEVDGADKVAVILMRSQRGLMARYSVDGSRRISIGNYDIYLPKDHFNKGRSR